MKILVSSLSRDFGGVESLFLSLCKNLQSDLSYDFICTDSFAAREKDFISYGAKVFYLPRPRHDLKKYIKTFKDIINNGNYDAFHVNLTRYVFPLDIILAKKYGLKVILHCHSTKIYESKSNLDNYIRKVEQIIFSPIYKIIGDEFIACSKTAGEYLFKNKNYKVIYNGIETSKFLFSKDSRNKIRQEFCISDDYLVIGHIGRFSPEKNHKFLIDILKKFKEVNSKTILLLVGQGDLFFEIKEYVDRMNLNENIILTGLREDIPDLLSAMDVFVFPSKHEAFPMTLLEAQSNGLNCVVSDVITKEINHDNMVTYLPLNLPKDRWVNTISNVLKNIDLEDRKNNNTSKFDIKNMISELEKIYLR